MNRKAASLLAQKVTRELYRIAQAYGKQHPFRFEDLTHDLAVMLESDSLNGVSLKFHRPNGSRDVLVEYTYELHAGAPHFYLDDAQGIGIVPLRPPFEMGLVVNRDPQASAYENRLRLNWGDAPAYARRGGFEHQDGNTTHRTGGRASKRVYMDGALRRRGQVKFYLPAKQYGFIAGENGGRPGSDVFFHANNIQGFRPRQGQWVTYLPLATPRGIQAKDVRLV
jgi:cold shock CspA family protein